MAKSLKSLFYLFFFISSINLFALNLTQLKKDVEKYPNYKVVKIYNALKNDYIQSIVNSDKVNN